MRYAIAKVGDRDIPAKQWINTLVLALRHFSIVSMN